MNDERIHLAAKEKRFLMKRLASLLQSGLPLVASIDMLQESARTPATSRILVSCATDVREGRTLAHALASFPRTFDRFDIGLVRIGEATGTLARSLAALSTELERRDATRRKVASALLYPAIIAIAIASITGFLLLYLFPRIAPVFASLHVELPLTTRIVMSVSSALLRYGIVIAFAFVLIVSACVFVWRRYGAVRICVARALLSVPVLRDLIRGYLLSNSLRMLARLLESGTSLVQSLMLLAALSVHPLYEHSYRNAAARVEQGGRMSDAFSEESLLFPSLVVEMVKVGEHSGSLAASVEYLASLYDTEIDELTRTLTSLVEPALMLSMGLVIGFIAVSIIAPIYGITAHLHP